MIMHQHGTAIADAMDQSKNQSPRVSVLVPSYNAEDCLEVAVRSVLAQTEPDFELLIIDDASTDGTLALAHALASQDERIRVIELPTNGGKVSAMNRGMSEATGEWIAVLDADDWFAPGRLMRLLDAGDAAGIDMVADDWIAVDSQAGLYLESPLPRRRGDIVLDIDSFLLASDPIAKGDYGMLKSIVRSDFIRRTGVRYHDQARLSEDFYYHLSFFLAGGHCLLVNEALYYYVEPFGSVSLKWAQDGRRRYKFETLGNLHRIFMNDHAAILTAKQKRLLIRRETGNQALILFHQLREALREGRYGLALTKIRTAVVSVKFWELLSQRSADRIRRLARGSPRRILGTMRS